MLRGQGKELKDELVGICQEVVVLVDLAGLTGSLDIFESIYLNRWHFRSCRPTVVLHALEVHIGQTVSWHVTPHLSQCFDFQGQNLTFVGHKALAAGNHAHIRQCCPYKAMMPI